MNTLPDWKAWSFRALLDRCVLLGNYAKRFAAFAALAVLTTLVVTDTGYAQTNTTGNIAGKVGAGSTVTAVSVETGYTRSVVASGSGAFTMSSMPPGRYKLTATGQEGEAMVEVSLASTAYASFGDDAVVELEKFEVTGMTFNPIDFSRTESVTVFNAVQLKQLPVARNTTDVALMAPGTVQGDPGFGNLASFGGASVAENAYFVDGFNLSDFRTGTNPMDIPFEAYNQFEVKTGGYSAEFGRSLGGVINATTKTGTNAFKGGFNVYYIPDAGFEDRPNIFYTNQSGTPGQVWNYNGADTYDKLDVNVYASGPILKDRLFFYGLYNARDIATTTVISSGNRIRHQKLDDPLYLGKLTANVFPGHTVEVTYIKNESDTKNRDTDYSFASRADLGTNPLNINAVLGGEVKIARYIGSLTDNLTLSAMWGKSENTLSTLSDQDTVPLVIDARAGGGGTLSGSSSLVSAGLDTRESMRLDLTYTFSLLGDHTLRAGFDRENNTSNDNTSYSGGIYYRYVSVTPGAGLSGGVVPAGVTQAVRDRVYQVQGAFDVNSDAYYIEDNVKLMDDRLLLRLGLRNESFNNLNKAGQSFIKIDDQLAPRVGASYDLFGDQKTKIYANYGRYHMPVASNTNVRLSGGELFTQDYYVLTSINADGSPVKGAKIGTQTVYSDGSIPDRDTIVDKNIKPMYQDEYIVGIDHALNKDYRVGIRGTYRELLSTMDDMIIDHALTDYAKNNLGIAGADFSGYNHYVLGNPGSGMQTAWDFEDGNGVVPVTLTAAQLQYTPGIRKYVAMEFLVEKIWDGKWAAQLSYTWSQNYGNTEGWVLSDNDQDDAGITIQFDTPSLQIGSYGYLANDRRHAFKFFGSYALTSELTLGTNLRYTSGRALNKLGWFNDPVVGTAYGSDYYKVSRGAAGRMKWLFENNLSLSYRPAWAEKKLTLQLDIFNVMNLQTVVERVETAELDLSGTRNATYMLPTAWQTPRRMQLSVGYDF
ncbi:MAG: TonB-dependent receptor [Opitutaceae bacterium]|nr:TonB-dependent receptor [Opitutaceae bacterium]